MPGTANVLALEEVRSGADGRRQELAALVIRKPADLPVFRQPAQAALRGDERRTRYGVNGVEIQILRRDLLELPHRTLRIEEVLPPGST